MGAAESSHPELSALSDKELIERLRENTKDVEVVRVLWDRHQGAILGALKAKVFGGFCPQGWSKETFLNQGLSRAFITFPQRMRCFRFEMSVKSWLHLIAASALSEELRHVQRQQREFDPGVVQSEDSNVGEASSEPTDEDQAFVFRSRYVTLRQKFTQNQFQAASGTIRKRLLLDLLKLHNEESDVDSESARALRLRYWREWTYSAIGDSRYGPSWSEREANRRLKEVERTLDDNCSKLYDLLGKLGIRSSMDI